MKRPYSELKDLNSKMWGFAINTAWEVIEKLPNISDDSKFMIEKTFVNYTLTLLKNRN